MTRPEGEKLAAALNKVSADCRAQIMVYGGDQPVEFVRPRMPDIRPISRAAIKSRLLGYIGYGWSGVVPTGCRKPMYAADQRPLWWWGVRPDRFLNRMRAANSEVSRSVPPRRRVLDGIDTPERFATRRKTIPAASG